MDRLGLIVNFSKPHARESITLLVDAARRAGIQIFAEPDVCAVDPRIAPCEATELDSHVQANISLGGDGSFLAAAHQYPTLPLIGINIGTLGYLTSVNEDELDRAMQTLATDTYHLHHRSTLTATIERAGCDNEIVRVPDALNDIVVSRPSSGHTVTLELLLDGTPISHYACDGIVVATPTGSTAYSLAIGGPILIPGTHATTIGIISPHALNARPLVIPDTTHITIRHLNETAPCHIFSDGQHDLPLSCGESITITRSPRSLSVIDLDPNPYTPLAKKLGLGAPFTR